MLLRKTILVSGIIGRVKNLKVTPLLCGANLSNTKLENAILNYSNLSEAICKDANLRNINLYSSICEKANFSGTNLEVANLAHADLKKAYFLKAYLGGGDVQCANLNGAHLIYCSLNSADLRESDLTGIITFGWNVSDIIIDNVTCDYVYIDLDGRKRIPKNRDFEKGEFEELLYKHDAINNAFLNDVKEKRAIRYVFISYVSEDYDKIRKLSDVLESNGIKVWLDKEKLRSGVKWENAIIDAIKSGIYFIACFSENSENKQKTFQRKEIRIALNELALMPDDKVWFIPVKLSDCKSPLCQYK
jgi:hypothetical protein